MMPGFEPVPAVVLLPLLLLVELELSCRLDLLASLHLSLLLAATSHICPVLLATLSGRSGTLLSTLSLLPQSLWAVPLLFVGDTEAFGLETAGRSVPQSPRETVLLALLSKAALAVARLAVA